MVVGCFSGERSCAVGRAVAAMTLAMALAMTSAATLAACEQDAGGSGAVCQPGQVLLCGCGDGTQPQASCLADGSGYGPCPCAGNGTGGQQVGTGGQQVGTGGVQAGSGGQVGTGGVGSGGVGSGGVGSGGSGSGGDGSGGMGNPDDELDAVRQACVDHINMYRAAEGLAPLMRASASVESCSDEGATSDSATYEATGVAHESAGNCPGLGAQNTCPGYRANNGVEAAMKGCLDQMWAEGPPPVPLQDCIRDYQGCFLKHGHYINMSSASSSVVSCGFYERPDGTWWMNQDFGN